MESRIDSELLAEYAGRGPASTTAFEELVRRYGAMVHRVCLRVLGEGRGHQAGRDQEGQLSVYAQRKPEKAGSPSPLCTFDFRSGP